MNRITINRSSLYLSFTALIMIMICAEDVIAQESNCADSFHINSLVGAQAGLSSNAACDATAGDPKNQVRAKIFEAEQVQAQVVKRFGVSVSNVDKHRDSFSLVDQISADSNIEGRVEMNSDVQAAKVHNYVIGRDARATQKLNVID